MFCNSRLIVVFCYIMFWLYILPEFGIVRIEFVIADSQKKIEIGKT